MTAMIIPSTTVGGVPGGIRNAKTKTTSPIPATAPSAIPPSRAPTTMHAIRMPRSTQSMTCHSFGPALVRLPEVEAGEAVLHRDLKPGVGAGGPTLVGAHAKEELGPGHEVPDGGHQEVHRGVLACLERVRTLEPGVEHDRGAVADGAAEELAPVDVQVGGDTQHRDRLGNGSQDGPAEGEVRGGVVHVVGDSRPSDDGHEELELVRDELDLGAGVEPPADGVALDLGRQARRVVAQPAEDTGDLEVAPTLGEPVLGREVGEQAAWRQPGVGSP